MEIRRATADDAPEIAAIIAEVAPEGTLGAQPPVNVDERTAVFEQMLAGPGPGAGWMLLEDDGSTVLGFASVQERHRGVLHLAMALRRGGRGRGGGRRLLETVIAHARDAGAHKVDLTVWTDNGRAIALYSSLGFEVEGILRDHFLRHDGSLRSAMIMGLRLGR